MAAKQRSSYQPELSVDSINKNVRNTVYAVRGELYLRASELQQQGKEIIFTNVGNPHALGQLPLTFPRQVMALMQAPFLMDHPAASSMFPVDVIAAAKKYLGYTSGGVGAYSDSRGLHGVRKEVAEFITFRDETPQAPVSPDCVFLTDGASRGVSTMLNLIIRDSNDGILCPIPQYPLYSATITLLGGTLVPYYLKEESGWGLDLQDLEAQLQNAAAKGIKVRALVFINPGNPTGQCMSADNLRQLIRFSYENRIVLLADEVYQENVYQDERPFISCRKMLHSMGDPYSTSVELVSFHTVSKGTLGECGQRGGYLHFTNINAQVMEQLYKIASISLCPNVNGQIMMGLLVNPPKPGDPSFPLYSTERKSILSSLRRRARLMTDGFNSCQGVTCNFTEGAMYSFPQITLPRAAITAAQLAGKPPDVFYCLRLLEATGISTVPGSGFGQKDGTFHLRTTILPAEHKMPQVMDSFKAFHADFMHKYTKHDKARARL